MTTPPSVAFPAPSIPGSLSVGYWIVAGLLYAGLGMLVPWALFLGFWQCIPFVLAVHWLRPRVLGPLADGRRKRG